MAVADPPFPEGKRRQANFSKTIPMRTKKKKPREGPTQNCPCIPLFLFLKSHHIIMALSIVITAQVSATNLVIHLFQLITSAYDFSVLLLPASEGWGKVLFSVCLSVHTSIWGGGRGDPITDLDRGGTSFQVQVGGGYPIQLTGGYPIQVMGGTPSQVWMEGGTPCSDLGRGTHLLDMGWVPPT